MTEATMQTFLPYMDFVATARVLDRRRLGKQRVEVIQILNALAGRSRGWQQHPCTRMWRGHSNALVCYGLAICDAWCARGYRDTCRETITGQFDPAIPLIFPAWLGDGQVHSAYRAALLLKEPLHYEQFGWTESPAPFAAWPVPALHASANPAA
jgi:Pyrimidine dimer DNA glycosylase